MLITTFDKNLKELILISNSYFGEYVSNNWWLL